MQILRSTLLLTEKTTIRFLLSKIMERFDYKIFDYESDDTMFVLMSMERTVRDSLPQE